MSRRKDAPAKRAFATRRALFRLTINEPAILSGIVERPLVDAFVADGEAIDADTVADSFGISKSQLAETIGINREAFYKRARSGAPKTQTRLREMLEILSRVSAWAGGKERAMAWYRAQPLSAFGGRTAESLVKTGNAATLRDYLDHIALGGYA